jgi:hypothetical protein
MLSQLGYRMGCTPDTVRTLSDSPPRPFHPYVGLSSEDLHQLSIAPRLGLKNYSLPCLANLWPHLMIRSPMPLT